MLMVRSKDLLHNDTPDPSTYDGDSAATGRTSTRYFPLHYLSVFISNPGIKATGGLELTNIKVTHNIKR